MVTYQYRDTKCTMLPVSLKFLTLPNLHDLGIHNTLILIASAKGVGIG